MDGRKLRAKRCALRDGSRLRSTKRFQFVFDVAVTLAGGIPSRLPFESSHLIWSFFMTMRKLGVKRKRSTPAMTPSCCSSSFLVNSYSNIIINNFSSKHYRPLLEISSSSSRVSLISHQLCHSLRIHTHHAFDASLRVWHPRTSSPEHRSCTCIQHGSIRSQRETRCTTRLDQDDLSRRVPDHQSSDCSQTAKLRRPHKDRPGSL